MDIIMAVLHVNKEEFNALIKNEKIVVADFFATWCGPCKMIAPILEELAAKYEGEVVVAKIDIDQEEELTASLGIMSVPTVLIFNNGKISSTEVGARTLAAYSAKIDSLS